MWPPFRRSLPGRRSQLERGLTLKVSGVRRPQGIKQCFCETDRCGYFELCSWPDLIVMAYANSKAGLFRLLAQGWDHRVAEDAERRLRGLAIAPPSGWRSSHHQSSPTAEEEVAGRVAAELAGILQEVERGARLLYDGLPVHSFGEGQLCTAVSAHLDRPCITDAEVLLCDLASTAALDMPALQ